MGHEVILYGLAENIHEAHVFRRGNRLIAKHHDLAVDERIAQRASIGVTDLGKINPAYLHTDRGCNGIHVHRCSLLLT